MKSIALALILALAAPALAADPEPPTAAQLCFGWLSLTPAQVTRIIARELAPAFAAAKLPLGRRARIVACVAGAVQTLQPHVRSQCLVGSDPSDTIRDQLVTAVDLCTAESAAKPGAVLPGDPEPDPE